MPVRAITFSVQLGAQGFDVAQAVAAKLGYRYYDWDIMARARNLISEGDAAESGDGSAERMMTSLMAAAVMDDELPPAMIGAADALSQQQVRINTLDRHQVAIVQIVRQIAGRGRCVIMGHGAQAILMDWPSILKVLIVRPFRTRAFQLAKEQDTSLQRAMKLLADIDRLKREYFERTYGMNWLDVSHYDLVVNTADLSAETAAALIVGASESSDWSDDGSNGLRAASALAEVESLNLRTQLAVRDGQRAN
jgi:cytidylate kinase